MGQRNDEFRKKFNELDKVCREKYHMFTDANGKYISKTPIYKFAEGLPEKEKNALNNLIRLRNLVEHNDYAEVNINVLKELDTFIAVAKGKYKLNNPKSFELVSYINYNMTKMQNELYELDLDPEEIPHQLILKIKDELYRSIEQLKKCNDLIKAKGIVRNFHETIDNIDYHPIILENKLQNAKLDAINKITNDLNDALNDISNIDRRNRLKDIARRYIEQINVANDIDRIDDLEYDACELIEDNSENRDSEVREAQEEAIYSINDTLNDTLKELFNPIKKHKVKQIAKNYINQIRTCHDVERIDELEYRARHEIEKFID